MANWDVYYTVYTTSNSEEKGVGYHFSANTVSGYEEDATAEISEHISAIYDDILPQASRKRLRVTYNEKKIWPVFSGADEVDLAGTITSTDITISPLEGDWR